MNISPWLEAIAMVKYRALTVSLRLERTTMVKCWEISQNVGVGYRTYDLHLLLGLVFTIMVICYALLYFYHNYKTMVVKRNLLPHSLLPRTSNCGDILLQIMVKLNVFFILVIISYYWLVLWWFLKLYVCVILNLLHGLSFKIICMCCICRVLQLFWNNMIDFF